MTHKTAQDVRDTFGFLTQDELSILRSIVLFNLPEDPVIVNIGAGYGTSGLLFLESREDTTVYTIDIQDEQAVNGSLNAERTAVKEAGLDHLAGTRWNQIHADSHEAINEWVKKNHGQIDLLFIDGDHSYEGCMGDLDLWSPFVKSGGWIIVHDYMREDSFIKRNPFVVLTQQKAAQIASSFPGVDRAVKEFLGGEDPTLVVDSLAIIPVSRPSLMFIGKEIKV
jgi:predicted O-methyltransferase YrrM